MQVLDGVALGLVVVSGVAFALGSAALARTEDLRALYWLIVGVVALRSAVHMARPRGA